VVTRHTNVTATASRVAEHVWSRLVFSIARARTLPWGVLMVTQSPAWMPRVLAAEGCSSTSGPGPPAEAGDVAVLGLAEPQAHGAGEGSARVRS
jgi:hypothetical protein